MTKLAIVAERDEDKFEFHTTLKCWRCDSQTGRELPGATDDPFVKTLADGVMQSLSSARQSEVKAWEEEIVPCEHTLTLEQHASGPIEASGMHVVASGGQMLISLGRACSLHKVRFEGEPLALPNMRLAWVWSTTVRGYRREWPRLAALRGDSASRLRQAWHHYA